MDTDKSQYVIRRLQSLKAIRDPFIDEWEQLSKNILSYRGQFNSNEKTRSRKKGSIINNTGMGSSRILASGLMGGVSSPTRPWVSFVTSNQSLMESPNVRVWLTQVQHQVAMVMARSNIYNSLHTVYTELGVFGTGAIGIYEDYDHVIRAESYTAGTYFIDIDDKGTVDTFYREFVMTGADIVSKFGEESLPDSVMNRPDIDLNRLHYDVIHAIEPNKNRKLDSPLAKNKAVSSTYVLRGLVSDNQSGVSTGNKTKVLSESGFDEFPIMSPRWDVIPGDVYGGMCPGMMAIGDVRILQKSENIRFEALEKNVNPVIVRASGIAMDNTPEGGYPPGHVIEVSNMSTDSVKSLYDVNVNLSDMDNTILSIEKRIKTAFFENLFLQMLTSDRREMTANEVDVRSNESLIALGPVLTRLHNELLDPLTDRVFNIMARAGILPEAPEELEDESLRVEYVSTLAKAQRADVSNTIERTAAFIAGLSEVFPDARHKFNSLQAIDEFSLAESVPPKIINSDNDANKMIEQERQAQQQQQQQQMMLEAAKVAPGVMSAVKEGSEMGEGA